MMNPRGAAGNNNGIDFGNRGGSASILAAGGNVNNNGFVSNGGIGAGGIGSGSNGNGQ